MRRTHILSVLLALLVAACGAAEGTTSETTEAAPSTTAVPPTTTSPAPTTTTTELTTTPTLELAHEVAEVNGVEMAYECGGAGSPAVIVLHGQAGPGFEEWNEDLYIYRPTMDAIEELTTGCFFGRPGAVGSESRGDEVHTASMQVEDIFAFIDAVGLEGPVVLAGHSWGGLLGLLAAHTDPERVAGLLLLDSTHPAQNDIWPDDTMEPFPPEFIDMETSYLEMDSVGDLGDLPVAVLSAGTQMYPEDEEPWGELQADLAAMSTNSTHETLDTEHNGVPFEFEAIRAAVEDLLDRVQS